MPNTGNADTARLSFLFVILLDLSGSSSSGERGQSFSLTRRCIVGHRLSSFAGCRERERLTQFGILLGCDRETPYGGNSTLTRLSHARGIRPTYSYGGAWPLQPKMTRMVIEILYQRRHSGE
jgi:hypothetical protein